MDKYRMIDLPEGYTVRENRMVGVDYLDQQGNILLQHPVDDNVARNLVCVIATMRNFGIKVCEPKEDNA